MEVKKFYDELTKEPLGKLDRERYVLRMRKSVSLMSNNGSVLDVGCRGGFLAKFLPIGSTYVGVDITSKWWDRSFDFVVASASNLPFKTEAFDNVFALQLVEHLFNPRKFLKEPHRVLRKNGNLILATPNIVCLLNRFKVLFGKWPSYFGSGSGHLHCFTYESLVEMLNPIFKVVQREPTYTLLPLRRLTKRLPLSLLRWISCLVPNFSDTLLIKAKKVD